MTSPLDADVLRALSYPKTALMWYTPNHADRRLAGRGEIVGPGCRVRGSYYIGGLIPGYAMRRLRDTGKIKPMDEANARPMWAGDPEYRVFVLNKEPST